MSEAELTLAELQRYVDRFERERGFDAKGVVEQCLLLGEEVGELFKAVRQHQNLTVEAGSEGGGVEEELADVLLLVSAVANRVGVDLSEALRRKEAVNRTRTWG